MYLLDRHSPFERRVLRAAYGSIIPLSFAVAKPMPGGKPPHNGALQRNLAAGADYRRDDVYRPIGRSDRSQPRRCTRRAR
jgi:hypothetical protein